MFNIRSYSQSTFSKIINFDETRADIGVHLKIIDEALWVVSIHECLIENEYKACTSILNYSIEGTIEPVNFIHGFKSYSGSVSSLNKDTLLLLGIDINEKRNRLTLTKNNLVESTTEIFSFGNDTTQTMACEGILEFNNAFYTYGHYDDLHPEERIKGFVRKWSKDFSKEHGNWTFGENEFLKISDMGITRDSHLVFTFSENKVGPGPENPIKLIKIDTLGEIIAEKIIEDSDYNVSGKVKITVDEHGDFYINHDKYGSNKIAKVDSDLDSMLWDLELPNELFVLDRTYLVREITMAVNGDVLVCGNATYVHEELELVHSGFVTRISADGEIIWLKILANEGTENNAREDLFRQSYLNNIIELPNGNIAGIGEASEVTFDGGTQDLWFVVMDKNGCIEGLNCDEDIYVLNEKPNSVQLQLLDNTAIKIQQNPVKDKLYLEIEATTNLQYRILDVQGHLINQGQYKEFVDVSHLPKGIFFLQIRQEDKLYQAKKFIKL